MKKVTLLLALLCCNLLLSAQGTVGLVAHWDMNGTVNDVSGHGHNGHGTNITAAVGMDGISGHGYHFDGSTSVVTVPYSPDWNFTKFSICAIIRSERFYTGLCQGNTIIARGKEVYTGNWAMYFDDNSVNNCSVLDTTKEVFFASSGTNVPSSPSLWQAPPNVRNFKWYKVIITYDSLTWKVYVDDTLRNTVASPGVPIGYSTDSVSIGMDIFDGSFGYPYYFTGIIDDIMIYNRALSPTEVTQYGDTCGVITTQPTPVAAVSGTNATFSVATSIAAPAYQWQQNAGMGYVNLSNAGPYSGVTTNSLLISGVTTVNNGYLYRCIISGFSGCADTSTSVVLSVTTGVDDLSSPDRVVLYPNPSGGHLTISNISVTTSVDIFDIIGKKVFSASDLIPGMAHDIDLLNVPDGIYFVELRSGQDQKCRVEKITIQH